LTIVQNSGRATFVGQWWPPGQPGKQTPGTLQIGTRYPELELHSISAAWSAPAGGGDRFDVPVLHGGSMGACLTLLDITETSSSTSSAGGLQETQRVLFVGTVLIGDDHLASVADCRFNRASFRLSNLNEWVNRSPYRWSSAKPVETVELLDLPMLRATIPGCEITLDRTAVSHHGRLSDSGFTSHEVIGLRFDQPQSLDELEYRFIRPLEQLLTLATGTSCKAFDVQIGNDNGSDDLPGRWPLATYTVRRRNTDMAQQDRPRIREHMRFGMNSTGYPPNIDFSEFIPRWFTLQAQLGTVCDLVFSRPESRGYLHEQMFSIASALEGMHRSLNPQYEKKSADDRARNAEILDAVRARRPEHHDWLKTAIAHAHRKSYAFRIGQLLDQTDHLMAEVVGDETKWTQQLRDIRDGIGHVLPGQDDKTVEQMIAVLYSARLFAELVLLRQLGFTAAQCRSSLGHHWELHNVREHVKKGYPAWFAEPGATRGLALGFRSSIIEVDLPICPRGGLFHSALFLR
jgi:ApeA N-terminal domain 1/Apea-like HEPN